MKLIPVASADDPRIASYRDIRERDLAGRQNRFVAEGKVVLNVLFSAQRFAAESALILDNRLAGMEETLATAPDGLPVYVAPREVMDRVAGFPIHRGVLAIGLRRQEMSAADLIETLPACALVVVALGISNHDNIGAIFRNAAAFGASAVLLDRATCDPLYRKAIRVSVGAALKIPFARAAADEIFNVLGEAGFRQLALSPAGATDIASIQPAMRTALYLGTEGEGLPQSILSRMQTVRIGMAAGFDSLNVAAASAVALHRLASLGGSA